MGHSSSSNDQTTQNEQQLSNISDINGSVVTGKGNFVSFSDQGAIQAAVDLTQSGQTFLGETFSSAIGLTKGLSDNQTEIAYRGLDLAGNVVGENIDFAGDTINQVSDYYDRALTDVSEAYGDAYQGNVANQRESIGAIQSAYNAATGSYDTSKVITTVVAGLGIVFVAARLLK